METNYPQHKILLVDDEPDIIDFMKVSLEQEGFEVSTANNGREALHHIMNEPPQLVVLDVMMPEIDGYEVLRRLKENETTAHIPIILLTAKDAPNDMVKGLEIGADFFWTKPFRISDLVRTIRFILEHELEHESAERQFENAQPQASDGDNTMPPAAESAFDVCKTLNQSGCAT